MSSLTTHLPKITVVTVCFNAASIIEDTMKSVWEQTYPNVEYWIIDGKSKDDTMLLVEKYAQCHFNPEQNTKTFHYISEPDKGIYDAMNKAFRLATGDYILFMNAGDMFQDYHSLENLMHESDDADFIYARPLRIQPDGEERPWHKRTPYPDRLSARSFLMGMVICHQCMMVHRRCWVEYDLQYRISADIDWAIRVLQKAKTYHFYDAIFCRYSDGGVSDLRRKQAVKERYAICKKHFGGGATLWAQVRIGLEFIWRGRAN